MKPVDLCADRRVDSGLRIALCGRAFARNDVEGLALSDYLAFLNEHACDGSCLRCDHAQQAFVRNDQPRNRFFASESKQAGEGDDAGDQHRQE